jgi:hypothetical protein
MPVVTCLGCRCDLRAPAGSEGEAVRCPKCRTRFNVPERAHDLRPVLRAKEDAPAPRPKAPRTSRRGGHYAQTRAGRGPLHPRPASSERRA